ncbi:Lrp/AsnC family transcriptional regulator [Nesterenkonia suensis]
MTAELDERLIRSLQKDGRRSATGLARELGQPRNIVAARIRALISEGRIRIVAAADPAFLGERMMAHVSITGGGRLGSLIEQLCARADVPLVSAVTGDQDVIVEVRTRDLTTLHSTLSWIRSFPEVAGVDAVLYVDVVAGVFISGYVGARDVDDLDLHLIELLREDGRQSCRSMAERVQLSESAVRKRVNRLLRSRIVTVGAVVAHGTASGRLKIGLGIKVTGADADVVDALRACPELEFAARTIGRFDIVATLNSGEPSGLTARMEALKDLPGVVRSETWFHLETYKEDYALTLPRETSA